MKVFNLIRLLLSIFIIVAGIIYIFLALGSKDNSSFIIASNENPKYIIPGDYKADIQLLDDSISIHESVVFAKDTLKSMLGDGGYSIDSIQIENSIKKYLSELLLLGWAQDLKTDADKIRLERNKLLSWKIGLFSKTKRLTIPILFTDIDKILAQKEKASYSSLNDSIAIIKYNGEIDYLLSEKSRIILKAKEGLVEKIFPDAKKTELLDESNSAIYYFDNKLIGNSFNKESQMTSTINVEIVNPLYNNLIGSWIREWSVSKIMLWVLVSMVTLFAEKIKAKFLQPLVDKIFHSKKMMQKRGTNK